MPDLKVGSADDPDPLESMSWQDVLDEVHGCHGVPSELPALDLFPR